MWRNGRRLAALLRGGNRVNMTGARQLTTDLKAAFMEAIPQEMERLKMLKKEHGAAVLGQVTVEQAVGGMRGIPALLWETSLLDAEEGIRFRGYSIPELQERLPGAKPGGEPLPEGMLWLLLTGQIPTAEQAHGVTGMLRERSAVPAHVQQVLAALPSGTHPMTQLCTAVLALQSGSKFAAAYDQGVHKSKYWEPVYEDSMDLIAKLPGIAAAIYRNTYKGGARIEPDPSLDWAANLAHQMGARLAPRSDELLCVKIASVGSALSDPYLSYAAGMAGLAGPLHGLANQETLRWVHGVQQELGESPTKEQLRDYVWATLKGGKVVPGFGHAVLRKTDPRYTCLRGFAQRHMPEYPLFRLVSILYEVVPDILMQTGKVKNPYPNVDAHSGVLLQYYGITEERFYTVLFGVSRALGVLSQGIWSRTLGLPIERPKSLTIDAMLQHVASNSREDYAAKNNVELAPTLVPATTPEFCKTGSAVFMPDTDLFGGDIPPTREVKVDFDVGGGDIFPDTVVAASSAEACCTMCHLTPDCGAFTFTGPENCASAETPWLFNATLQTGEPGCCYLKVALLTEPALPPHCMMKFSTGFEEVANSTGVTSGVLPAPSKRVTTAKCELLPESDTSGADLTFDPILPDLVVPGSSPSDCCNACASIKGCGAFTLTPSLYCEFRLGPANPGCCFLKPKDGWEAVADNSTRFFTSGTLLGV
ncbi:hypothetical protein COHA_008125 [Chlorella ohadii]|uniref:Citrate synthase n=1 Tax=Chlorella ohadii TaxID=2649997 RepID=A0AAD5GZ42_9CHLO|nr:hypothetical protein COHA_008125 [Chlorella ohadii]